MTTKIWVGGGNNNASNGKDWSPTGAPKAGDVLDTQTGTWTMNIRGNELAGNTLNIGLQNSPTATTPTLNLSHHAKVSLFLPAGTREDITINVKGSDELTVNTQTLGGLGGGELTINLGGHAKPGANLNLINREATITGGKDSLVNAGSNSLAGSHLQIDTNVDGGSFDISTVQSVGGYLEFAAADKGSAVTVLGDPDRRVTSTLQIDEPHAFTGSVALGVLGEVDLQGLLNATSYDLKNDILSIYSGHCIIDKVDMTLAANSFPGTYNFMVDQTTTGVVVARGVSDIIGTALPVHS